MRKKLFTFLLALVASVGLMNAKVTWNSSNISDINISGTGGSYSKEGVTLSVNADDIEAYWYHYGGDESKYGILFYTDATGGYTFSNTLGKNFTKIEMFPTSHVGWTGVNLGSGWLFSGEDGDPVTWNGNASTVDLLKDVAGFTGENVKSIVFYFEGDSEEPATPTVYNSGSVALSNLNVGDILMAGVTVTSEKADYRITLAANRLKFMNSVRSSDLTTQFSSINPVLGENAVILTSTPAMFYTPIDEDGNIGNAWEVTANEVGTKVTLAGITYSGTTPASSDEGSGSTGALPGVFSVSGTKVVYFSQGNLQATTADNGSTWTWGFAEHQYDFIGDAVANNAINGGGTVSANGAVDLFGWSSDRNNYFGIDNSAELTDYDGNFQDWGAKMGSDWRTLTYDEWEYLLLTREPGSLAGGTSNPRFTRATILTDGTAPSQDIFGLILFPDDFNDGNNYIEGVTWNGINSHSSYVSPTSCTTAGWATLESMGCVFLPAPGWRSGDAVTNVGAFGIYWASTKCTETDEDANCMYFSNTDVSVFRSYFSTGASVRLVSETAPGGSTPANSCGDGLTWEFNAGVLTISYDGVGTGVMDDFDYLDHPAPWQSSKESITSVIIPDGVTRIGNNAFSGAYNLASVSMGDNVVAIGNNAFEACNSLSSITLSSHVTTIGDYAFAGLQSLTSIVLPSTVQSIGTSAFYGNEGLTSITCEGTTPPTLGQYVFGMIGNGATLYVPYGYVETYQSADSQWQALNMQVIGSGSASYPYCGDGLTWTYNNGVLTIIYDGVGTGDMLDYGNYNIYPWDSYKDDITSVIIPDGVIRIGSYAFANLTNLASVSMGDDVVEIGYGGFWNCLSLQSITLGSHVTTIGEHAFGSNHALTSITLPNTLQTIGGSAFYNCNSLPTITIPSSVTSFGEYAFGFCEGLTSFTCEGTTPPTLGQDVFTMVPYHRPLYVPDGYVETYQGADSQWQKFDISVIPGGDPTPDPEPTPSTTGRIFANCYDCWRNPDYPTISGECTLSHFGNPGVGNENPSGPWKLEFVEYYNSSSTEYYADIVDDDAASEYGKTLAEMEVYRLYQWQNGAYQPVAYGVLYAYANESNPVEHAAFFEANGYWGCYLTGNTHSDSEDIKITFNEDASTGFADLHGAPTPAVDPAVQNVIDLINAIPNPVVYNQECFNALNAVYDAYVALSEEQRNQVTNYDDYVAAEERYYMLGSVNNVIETINEIGNVEFTPACKHRIDYARSEYCNLTLEAKGYVTNYNTLLAAEAAYAALIPVSSTVVWDEAILETIDADEWGEATYTNGSLSLKAVDGRARYIDDEEHFLFDGSNSEKSFVFSCTSANMLCIEITVSEKHEHNELSCAWQETATGYRWVGEATSVDLASTIFKVTGIRFSLGEAFPEPTPTPAQDGDKLPGAFSVDDGKVVYFSKGNLQYLGNIERWHFAENQWTIIGNAQASDSRDLFSWGTGDNPDSDDYSTYTEWGNNIEGNWRTLTVEEWTYLFNGRTDASSKYGTATVAGVVGLILLPDVYDGTAINSEHSGWDNNVISSSEWAAYEAEGAVFLPTAGMSEAYDVGGVGVQGFYWSSTMDALSHYANAVFFGFDYWEGYWFNQVDAPFQPQQRNSVRLVSETAPTPASANPVIKLNADFGGDWADTDAFTDNGNGKASWSISTLTAGEWYHFGVKVDGTWTSDNAAFDREHPSRAISGTGDAMWFQADVAGEYTFTWEYATNTLTIGFPVPTVGMKGSWDNWTDEVNFTDNGNGTASVTKTFEHEGYYTFKTVLDGDDWRGNGEAFKRNYTGAKDIVGNTDMTLWIDAKGEYTFTWTYASNRIDITYPALPTVYLYLNGSTDAFTNRGNGTATYDIHFSSPDSYKEFKIRLGESDWRSNGQIFNPEHTTYDWINDNGGGAYMQIYVDAEADYTFTWTYVENKLEITHPVVPDYTVMTKVDPENPGVYYSTFYSSNYSYKLMDDGTEAFIASISGGDLVLTMIAEGEQVIPAGTAVIFRKTGSSLPVGLRDTEENNTSFDPADNDLRGVDVATLVTDITGLTLDNCYVLSGKSHDETESGVGFYLIYGNTLRAHKAYVIFAGGSNNAPKKMRFVYGQATGIEDVQGNNVQSTKVIENGVLYIIRDGKTYNAMGQIVK